MRMDACQEVIADAINPPVAPIDAVTATRMPADVSRKRSATDPPLIRAIDKLLPERLGLAPFFGLPSIGDHQLTN
jgi:hypothetical protein